MIIVDGSIVPLLAKALPEMKTVEHVLVHGGDGAELAGMGPADLAVRGRGGQPADDLRLAHGSGRAFGGGHVLHQRHHRKSEGRRLLPPFGLPALDGRLHGQRVRRRRDDDRVLPVVPMFHANAWGLAYAAWMAGADMIMPDRYLQAEYLCPLMTSGASDDRRRGARRSGRRCCGTPSTTRSTSPSCAR